MTDRRRDDEHEDEHVREVSEEEAEELEEEAAERNPDPQTRREALELELMEEDRSEAGEDVGDEID
ncbi:MAG TPA: hypothetical protein VFA62_02685 [Acidimicrobiia bacterium]|nr:hypothetical protein [Acidimicrobiia bacterium]